MLLDMPNAALKCNSAYGEISALKTVPPSLSLCVTIRMTQAEWEALQGDINFLGNPNRTYWAQLIGYRASTAPTAWGLRWNFRGPNDGNAIQIRYKEYMDGTRSPNILDGKPHTLVCTINAETKKMKAFLDGEVIVGGKITIPDRIEYTATNSFRVGTAYPRYNLTGGCALSNIKYFNFDISATGAPYTLDDYQNNRDIPDGTSGVILNLHNKLSGNTWQDESGNGYDMALQGDFEITDE